MNDPTIHTNYWIVGLVVTNLGAMGSLIMVAFRVTWWISKLESRVDESKSMAIRAHKRLDKVEDKLN